MNLSIRHSLDNPVWAALNTRHAYLGAGGSLARRYHADIAPFAAVVSNTAAAWQELHGLMQPGEQVVVLALDPIDPVEGLHTEQPGVIHQMVATGRAPDSAHDPAMLHLSHLDAPDMLELASRTKPGPFSTRTHETGHYIGYREREQLIAMAGERMCIDGCVELSAVCVHEAHRGRGLAGRLVNSLRGDIERRGDTPFLHVFSDNRAAIGLYERLGFELRQVFRLVRIKRID